MKTFFFKFISLKFQLKSSISKTDFSEYYFLCYNNIMGKKLLYNSQLFLNTKYTSL